MEEKYKMYVHWGQQKALPRNGDDLDQPFEGLQGDRFIVGDPDQVLTQLERYRRTPRVNHVILRLQWGGPTGSLDHDKVLRCIRLIGRHVIPYFQRLGGRADLGASHRSTGTVVTMSPTID